MTSCSSFDEPAAMDREGEVLSRSATRAGATRVTNEAAFLDAISEEEEAIEIAANFTLTSAVEVNYPLTLSGANGIVLTTNQPIVCKSNVNFSNLTIDATTPRGTGAINLEAENINVLLDGVKITQHTAGADDDLSVAGIGIKNATCNNKLTLRNTTIDLPGNYVRGINMYTVNETYVDLELDGCVITCGTNLSLPSTYSRLISFSGAVSTKEGTPVLIKNSTLQGAYYIINSNGTRPIEVSVSDNSVLDGRAGFNIWSEDFTINVENSTLIGRNNYNGPQETFANIVINNNGTKIARNCDISLTNVTFKMFAKQFSSDATNIQYAIQYRASDQKLYLDGTITVIDDQTGLPAYVVANQGVSNIQVGYGESYKFDSSEASCKQFI